MLALEELSVSDAICVLLFMYWAIVRKNTLLFLNMEFKMSFPLMLVFDLVDPNIDVFNQIYI